MGLLDILGNIGFDWRVALANLFNFLIIFYLLKRFAFGPIQKILSKRQSTINEGLENAQRAQTELMMAEEKQNAIINESKKQANEIIANGRKKEKELIKKAREKAEQTAQNVANEAVLALKREEERMNKNVRDGSVDLVISGIQKVLNNQIDAIADERIVKHAIAEL